MWRLLSVQTTGMTLDAEISRLCGFLNGLKIRVCTRYVLVDYIDEKS